MNEVTNEELNEGMKEGKKEGKNKWTNQEGTIKQIIEWRMNEWMV